MARRKTELQLVDEVATFREVEHFSVSSRLLRATDSLRLDASHFDPAVAHALETLRYSGMRLAKLGDVTERVFIPPRFKRIYVGHGHGIPFLQGSHVVHFRPADVKYLSRKAHRNIGRWIVEAGWVLVTCSGTIGRATICPKEWDGWAASQHILRIIPNESACPSGYLLSFLTSPLGHIQLTRQIYGAVVDELTEDQAKSVMVPLPATDAQRELVANIDRHARKAIEVRSTAVQLTADAEDDVMALVQVDRHDVKIARQRLAEIKADPNSLMSGEQLEASLDELVS